MAKILILTSGSGSLLDICLNFDFFKDSIKCILSDRECDAKIVAKKHGIKYLEFSQKKSIELNELILQNAIELDAEFIISYSYLRLIQESLLNHFKNKIFNSHFSILPAFKGYYDKRDFIGKYNANQIFERTLEFGSRITGNTIHLVDESVDQGTPVITSVMNIPYNEDPIITRHKLFNQECQSILQLVDWLNQGRFKVIGNRIICITDAKYSTLGFSPNLERNEILKFTLPVPKN